MMPGITISFLFSEQRSLICCTTPLEDQLACSKKPIDDSLNRLGVQIRAANFPRSAGSCLFTLQQACIHQSFDRPMTHATDPSGFAQADSFRIRQCSFLTGNRIVAAHCGHTVLIPTFPLPCGMPESVQYGSNLVIALAHGHPRNDFSS